MGDLRIGNAKLPVEGIRPLKGDFKLDAESAAATKNQLQKDGFDEIIFQKGDQLYIAYQKNMNLDKLNLNSDPAKFDVNSAYDPGQLSLDGDAVRVLYVDDENKSSLWTQPFRTAGRAAVGLLNDPYGKAAVLGFVGGAVTVVAGKNLDIGTSYKNGSYVLNNATHDRLFTGTLIGTGVGGVIGGLKAGAEAADEKDWWETGAGLGSAAVGYGLGAAAGWGGDELVKLAKNNVKTAAITAGVAAVVVGTGVALDAFSDNNKPATYRVINSISEGTKIGK